MNPTVHKFDFSRLALFLSAVWILAVGFFYYPKWEQKGTEATISWDVSGYYHYLPAIFIYKDLKKQQYKDSVLDKYQPTPIGNHYEAFVHSSGNYIMKYSIGQAIIFSPFFFAAHVLAKPLGYEADGYSYPYNFAIGVGLLLIAIIGLFFLRKVLLIYFSPLVTGITLLLYVLATNYLEYAAITDAMTHNSLFTLYAFLLYLTIKFYDKPGWRYSLGIGFTVGLMTLIRPSEVLSAIIPVCWGLSSAEGIKDRILFFRKHLSKLITAVLVAGAVISIQLIYWKYASGSWIVYSYQKEKYHLLHPYIAECLWQFRKGWLIYTPIMIFSIIGFYFLYKKYRSLFWVCLLFAFPFTYLCFSWEIWWYGGSIGQRAMVQAYPVLAIPFAATVEYFFNKKLWIIPSIIIMFVFSYYNLWLTHQAHKGGLLDPENMTRAYWQKILFKYNVPVEARKLLDTDEEYLGERTNVAVVSTYKDSVNLNSAVSFSPELPVTVPLRYYKWLRVYTTVSFKEKEWDVWRMAQLIVKFRKGDETVKEKLIRVQRLVNETGGTVIYMDVKIPRDFNTCNIVFWNGGSNKPISFTNTRAEVYNEP